MRNSLDWLDFTEYENKNSKFNAELSNKGGYITYSNSGKGGNKKFFTLSLESFLICLKDILANHTSFVGHEKYDEKEWRDLGSRFYTDKAANAQCTVQTKPTFATLSKIIMWANSPSHDNIDPEERIVLDKTSLQNAVIKLSALSDEFTPPVTNSKDTAIDEKYVYRNKSIREFAKYVFSYFFENKWGELLSETNRNQSSINEVKFISHDYKSFKRLIGEFDSAQSKESLTTSNTTRYFDEPIYVDSGKYFYFTTQWTGEGDYNLSFSNLKTFFEECFPDYLLKKEDKFYLLIELGTNSNMSFSLNSFIEDVKESGLSYSDKIVSRFIASLLTKPFVILTGLSGSGKTKMAQAFMQWICEDETQYKIVPVGADWTNREPLLGFPNALNPKEYVKPDSGVLDLILQAGNHPDIPFFILLDEMNLSHVERYFADFLSVMESKEHILLYSKGAIENGVPPKIKIPSNLFIIGTVNIDETTNMFSPKVLDRANTIEFRVTDIEMENFLNTIKDIDMKALTSKGAATAKSFLDMASNSSIELEDNDYIKEQLLIFFKELEIIGAEFGYRTASEMLRLIHQLGVLDDSLTTDEKIDIAIMQKLLPKLHGSRRKLISHLETLGDFCLASDIKVATDVFGKEKFDYNKEKYPISLEKIARMHKGAIDNGFTSFAEA